MLPLTIFRTLHVGGLSRNGTHPPESRDTPEWLARRLPASWVRVRVPVFICGMSRTTIRQSLNSTKSDCRCLMSAAFPYSPTARHGTICSTTHNQLPLLLHITKQLTIFWRPEQKHHCNPSYDDISSTYAPKVIIPLR